MLILTSQRTQSVSFAKTVTLLGEIITIDFDIKYRYYPPHKTLQRIICIP